ncbi:MAG: hypothetical protein F6J97_25145 [Leptolyngbya sp. SIO4C1]|nr:hypothetical protein [Leptolyngbya sp. SIO4C1]
MFEESGDFPINRSELYQEGLDVLLKKWDASRNIERAQAYQKMSRQRKEDLLSNIAFATFERSDYFFKRQYVENEIRRYIRNLPDSLVNAADLEPDCQAILKSIESQHGLIVERAKGIYSFSHLTFHEFFASRKIATSFDPTVRKAALTSLVTNITEKRWREVFLLVVGMLQNTDYLLKLMKSQIDSLLAENVKFQKFLTWGCQKALSVSSSRSPLEISRIRGFYFHLSVLSIGDEAISSTEKTDILIDASLSAALGAAINLAYNLELTQAVLSIRGFKASLAKLQVNYETVDSAIQSCLSLLSDSPFQQALNQLYSQLPRQESGLNGWWQLQGQDWIAQLRQLMIRYRNIGHNWQFSEAELACLKQYYEANRLLFECIHSDCYASREVREAILQTMFLPARRNR